MKDMRKRARLTLKAAGDLVGVSMQAVGQWESGNTSPTWDKLRALDDGYGAGGALLALFNDTTGVSQLDELADRMEALVLYLIRLAEWMEGLAALGADVSKMPDVSALTKRAAP